MATLGLELSYQLYNYADYPSSGVLGHGSGPGAVQYASRSLRAQLLISVRQSGMVGPQLVNPSLSRWGSDDIGGHFG